MAHNLLIAAHALAGVICFVAGVVAIRATAPASQWFRVYLGSLVALVVFLFVVRSRAGGPGTSTTSGSR